MPENLENYQEEDVDIFDSETDEDSDEDLSELWGSDEEDYDYLDENEDEYFDED